MAAEPAGYDHSSWRTAHSRLISLLDEVGATEEASTVIHSMRPIEASFRAEFYKRMEFEIGDDLPWQAVTFLHEGDDACTGYALPVSARWTFTDPSVIFYLDMHMSLVAWWLTTAWRVRQLAEAALTLHESGKTIAAASCVRPLVETAASFWMDGRKIANAWSAAKERGPFTSDDEGLNRLRDIWQLLSQATVGSKFDDRVPRLQRDWGVVARSNVLGDVEKLSKAYVGTLQEDYQWLCNTVHPSLGNMLAFAEPWYEHPSRTFTIKQFAARPCPPPPEAFPESREAFDQLFLIQKATVRVADAAIAVLVATLDASLRVIDDVAITTEAPPASRTNYWRQLHAPERNGPCPCRSGRKSKLCPHRWGNRGPELPLRFE